MAPLSNSITLDSSPPPVPTIDVIGAPYIDTANRVSVRWGLVQDSFSSIAGYQLTLKTVSGNVIATHSTVSNQFDEHIFTDLNLEEFESY